MKNKFMTKALAVALSASMALSLSSATALTANAAAAPKLAKKTVSVKAGKKAKNKLKAASYKAGWRITKATVKKTKVAKAKVKKNKKVVVVTGVQKGKSKVVVNLKNQKTGAAKKIKFTVKVKVDKVVIEEPVVETASLVGAVQKTHDSVILTFDKAIDATQVSNETVAINGSVGAATSVTIDAADATKVTVVYGFAENTEYTFSVTGLAKTATITTGSFAVTSIAFEDQQVEAGTDQPIVYSLLAGEVDVTKYSDYLSFVDFQVEGDQSTYSPDPAKPTICFDDKDQKSTVTITFNNGVGDAITKTAVISSIAATASEGEARFASGLKKWYLVDDTTDTFNITPDGTGTNVVFYAKNSDKKAIKFSDVEVTSSNENVATASYTQGADGKFYTFAVAPGGDQGNAKITIKAVEYKGSQEVSKEYSFNVVSKEKNNNIYNVNAGATSVSLYNGQYGHDIEVEMKPVNSLNEEVTASETIEVLSGKEDASAIVKASWSNNKLKIDALGAPAGTYKVTITLTGESGSNTKDITKNVNVRVTDVLSSVYAATNENDKPAQVWAKNDTVISADPKAAVKADLSANYKIEVGNLSITDTSCGLDTEVKLAVYVNSKPIGYFDQVAGVKGYAEGTTIAKRVISKSIKDEVSEANIDLGAVMAYVYSGSNYYGANASVQDGVLYLGQNNKAEYTTQAKAESTNTIHAGQKVSIFESSNQAFVEYYGAGNQKNSCAKEGNYNVVVKYMNKFKQAPATYNSKDPYNNKLFSEGIQLGNAAKFTVSYGLTMPEVEYNPSSSAENYVTSNVDLVRAADGTSVSYATVKRDAQKTFKYADNDATFAKTSLAKGDSIYAVRVKDKRGDGTGDLDVEGGAGKVMIHFIFEKTTKIKA
jgi:hypothetical protein